MPNINLSQKSISLDLQHTGYTNTIYAQQGDVNSRRLTISLYDDGTKYNIPKNATVSLCGTRADNTVIYRDVNSFNKNIVVIDFENAELAAKGIAKYKIEIKTTDNGKTQLLSSFGFKIKVYENIYDEDGKIASPQYSDLQRELDKIHEQENAIKEAEENREQVEGIRKNSETERVNNENRRKQTETERINAENDRITEENKRQQQEGLRVGAETQRNASEAKRQEGTATAISNAEKATNNANTAATKANKATDDLQNKLDSHHFVLTEDKDVAGGVPSLDDNAKVPASELYKATTTSKGITQLTDSVTSDSTTTAATPNSVKTVNDDLTSKIDSAYANSNAYTDQKIAELIGGAPETMDTLKEVADAIAENKNVEEALNEAIGKKANQSELDTHTGNATIHVTATDKENLKEAKAHADSTHAPSNAQVNVIETVKVNGTALTPSFKAVDITKEGLGFGNVENKSSETIRSELTSKNVTDALGYTPTQQSDIDSAVEQLEIGGRNLIKYDYVNNNAGKTDKSNFVAKGEIIHTDSVINGGFRFDSVDCYNPSTVYTLSGYLTVTSNSLENVYFYNGKGHIPISFTIDGKNFKNPIGVKRTDANDVLNDGNRHYFELKFKTLSSIPPDSGTYYTYMQLNKESATSITYKIEEFQLENGNKPTPWTPAPEDIEKAIQTVDNKLTNNLLNPTLDTTEKNGITCTNNGDGTYTLNGTASEDTFFELSKVLHIDKKLKLVGCPPDGTQFATYMLFTNDGAYDDGNGVIRDSVNSFVGIAIYSGFTCNNLLFKPMLTTNLNADYSMFVSYTGSTGQLNSDVAEVRKEFDEHTHNYAGSSSAGGDANSLVYFKCTSTKNVGAGDTTANAIGYVGNISLFGQSDGALYKQVYSSSWVHEIFGDYRTGQIAIRGKNNGTWQSWRTVLDSSNYTSYTVTKTGTGASGSWGINITGSSASCTGNSATATKLATARTIELTGSVTGSGTFDGSGNVSIATTTNHTHSYLPLSGGTMTGQIQKAGTQSWWVTGRTNAMIRHNSYTGYNPILSMKTTNGSWELGAYESDVVHLSYITDTNFNEGTNEQTTDIQFKKDGTIVANTFSGALSGNASTATNADKLDGYYGSSSQTANTYVLRDGNGYIFTNYINSNTGNNENPTISQIIVTNGSDNYYRKASLSHLKSSLGSMPASDVYSWAKASSKPSYSWDEITSKPSTFTPSTHDHNSIYYTKAQVDAADLALENGLSTLSTGKADYEIGTWSPTISNSSVSCIEEKSPYVKIGSIVLLWAIVDVNTTNRFGVNGFPISVKSMLSACIFDIDTLDDYNSGKLLRDGSAYHVYFQCPTGCKRIFIIYSC